MKIFVFGNPDLKEDSLPIKILPRLQKEFPSIGFEVKDPNEEWDVPEELTVIDTTIGIKDVQVFDNLDYFSRTPKIGMHDFDALANLRYLQKLGKIKKIKIIGIPPDINPKKAIEKLVEIFEKI